MASDQLECLSLPMESFPNILSTSSFSGTECLEFDGGQKKWLLDLVHIFFGGS